MYDVPELGSAVGFKHWHEPRMARSCVSAKSTACRVARWVQDPIRPWLAVKSWVGDVTSWGHDLFFSKSGASVYLMGCGGQWRGRESL